MTRGVFGMNVEVSDQVIGVVVLHINVIVLCSGFKSKQESTVTSTTPLSRAF